MKRRDFLQAVPGRIDSERKLVRICQCKSAMKSEMNGLGSHKNFIKIRNDLKRHATGSNGNSEINIFHWCKTAGNRMIVEIKIIIFGV